MSEEPESRPLRETPVGWVLLWIFFAVLPGSDFPLIARFPAIQGNPVFIMVILVAPVVGMIIATDKILLSSKAGCWVIGLGMAIMVVSFFIGFASQVIGLASQTSTD